MVTTPTVRTLLTRRAGNDRSRAGAGATAHASGDEHHVRAADLFNDVFERFLGSDAADVRPGAGTETLSYRDAQLNAAVRERLGNRLRIGVGNNEFYTLKLGTDHVVDGVAARAANSDHGNPRTQFRGRAGRGNAEVDGHRQSLRLHML